MSRLFAKYIFEKQEMDITELERFFENLTFPITGKYLTYKKMFEFKVVDILGFPFCSFFNVQISEVDLRRMIKIDSYSEDEKNELFYHDLLKVYEQEDLDDDTFYGISIIQYFYHLSTNTITEMKRQAHLRKLNKVDFPYVCLKKRVLHSNGGRKLGSLSSLTDVDLQNIDNAEEIIRKCVERDWYHEFMDLHRLLVRTKRCELSLTGAKWKFTILRYKWKKENGFVTEDLEYEKKLTEKNLVYNIFDTLVF